LTQFNKSSQYKLSCRSDQWKTSCSLWAERRTNTQDEANYYVVNVNRNKACIIKFDLRTIHLILFKFL